jgi:peptidoglycan/LPS O-acetylase OafA/YrhL
MFISDKLQAANNRPAGFDYLRLSLAILVVGSHFTALTFGAQFQKEFWLMEFWGFRLLRPFLAVVLPMFFALSGFLIAASLFRCKTLISFYGLRILRIVPALAVEITLSALILGPLVTNLSLASYFNDPLFWSYFLNIIGDIHFLLPGVFLDNTFPKIVNGQLWTIPWELWCYILVGIMSIALVLRSRWILLGLVLGVNAYFFVWGKGVYGPEPAVNGVVLVACFLAGVVLFAFKDKVAHDWKILVACTLASFVLLLKWDGEYLAAFPIAYMTVHLGLLDPPRSRLLFSGDYSYGMYLYGFPLQQTMINLNHFTGVWYYVVAISTYPLIVATAVISWWLIENRALSLKRYLPFIEQWGITYLRVVTFRARENLNPPSRVGLD